MTNINATLQSEFYEHFGHSSSQPQHFFAPGRVNLIGEYTDFNGGMVLPCAIERGIHLLIRKTPNRQAQLVSSNFKDRVSINLDEPLQRTDDLWANYPKGVFNEFVKSGIQLSGMQLYFSGDVPDGAGLSSSAALEVLAAYAINALHRTSISKTDLALLAQRAENQFINVQCGIMDQFAVAMAQADHAIELQCNTLKHQQVPLGLGDYRILISNTAQRRELADSAYNDRVNECNAALSALGDATGAKHLAELTPQQLQDNIHLLQDALIRKRAIRPGNG